MFIMTDKVKTSMMSDTLLSIGLTESTCGRTKVWFRKKPMELYPSENEEPEYRVGDGVNGNLLSDTP